jgi:hypothetical protein
MLFFMAGGSHAFFQFDSRNFGLFWLVLAILIGTLELNAIFGKLGRIATIKGVITAGFILTAVIYALIEIIL